jgi:putative OPT family oligopeptide transporter
MGYWDNFEDNFWWITIIAGFGGMLGVLFTIPLRRALIVESDLKFPEGIATAEVLESGQKGGSDIWYIVKSAVAGGLFKLCAASGFRILPDAVAAATQVGRSVAYIGTNLSPALLSVGYIVGLNIAFLIVFGGALNWLVAIPICSLFEPWGLTEAGDPLSAADWAFTLWSSKTRYLGVGGMLVGGLWTIFKMRKSLVSGVMSGLKAYQGIGDGGKAPVIARTEKDMPMKWVIMLIVGSIVPLFLVYQVFVQNVGISLIMAVVMLITGFLFSAVAGYMAGVVGSSNNPISGVTIATVTISAFLLLLLMGADNENGPPAAIIIGGVVCCAAAIAGDNMQDLKAGHILGATPWKQQVMQMVGTLSSALVMAPVLMLLYKAYGFAGHSSAQDSPLVAAQANLMASVATGVFDGNLPWLFVGIGAIMAALIIILDEYLAKTGASFRTPVLAVTIGIYLPLELEIPIFIGGVVHYLIKSYQKKHQQTKEVIETSDRRGLLFASGLITGEALIGIGLAIPIVVTGRADAMALVSEDFGPWPGLILLAGITVWLYRIGRGKKTA